MMSKKMKKFAVLEAPKLPVFEDARTRMKHQALLQDYEDLQKELNGIKHKLDAAKDRKLRLLAEVRFLHQRRKHLIEMKSLGYCQHARLNMEKKGTQNSKGSNSKRKEAFKLPPRPEAKPKGKLHVMKDAAVRNSAPVLDLKHKQSLDVANVASLGSISLIPDTSSRMWSSLYEPAVQNTETLTNLKLSQLKQGGNDTAFGDKNPIFDLNKDTSFGGNEVSSSSSRAPIFDLNEISAEEEEMQNTYEPMKFEEPKIGLMRVGNEEQPNDLKLSVCRNSGEGSSRMGKRKISWQDPVALRV